MPVKSQKPDKNLSRWERHKLLEMTPEQIAEQDGISVETVRQSIQKIELRKRLNTIAEMESGQIEIIHHVKELEKTALSDALTATKTVKIDGKDEVVPDHEIRLKGIEKVNDKITAIQPRLKGQVGPSVQVNVQQNQSALGAGALKSVGFEDVLRQIRNKQQSQLPAPQIMEAEIVQSSATEEEVAVEG